MGPNSVAGIIPIWGRSKDKVDSGKDILLTTYALMYDLYNKKLLTHEPGKLITRIKKGTISGRFAVLIRLASKKAPRLVPFLIQLEQIAFAYYDGLISPRKYYTTIRAFFQKYFPPQLLDEVEAKICAAERRRK